MGCSYRVMSSEIAALSIYVVTGMVYILVSIPLLFDRIGPNRFYGFRIAKAYESTENVASGKPYWR